MLNARVVDEHVDASEFARRMLDQPRGVGWIGEIGVAKGHGHAVGPGNLLAQLPDLCGVAEAVDHEIRTGSKTSATAAPVTPIRMHIPPPNSLPASAYAYLSAERFSKWTSKRALDHRIKQVLFSRNTALLSHDAPAAPSLS